MQKIKPFKYPKFYQAMAFQHLHLSHDQVLLQVTILSALTIGHHYMVAENYCYRLVSHLGLVFSISALISYYLKQRFSYIHQKMWGILFAKALTVALYIFPHLRYQGPYYHLFQVRRRAHQTNLCKRSLLQKLCHPLINLYICCKNNVVFG